MSSNDDSPCNFFLWRTGDDAFEDTVEEVSALDKAPFRAEDRGVLIKGRLLRFELRLESD